MSVWKHESRLSDYVHLDISLRFGLTVRGGRNPAVTSASLPVQLHPFSDHNIELHKISPGARFEEIFILVCTRLLCV